MSKRGVSFIKPEEPEFLKRLKREAGYKEGPTVNTKFENNLEEQDGSSSEDDSEQPQVVVLKPGDLTKEQALKEEEKKKIEEEQKPADLTQRIIFKARPKKDQASKDQNLKDKKKAKPILSFEDDEDEEDDA